MVIVVVITVAFLSVGLWLGWWLIRDRKWGTFLGILAVGMITFMLMLMTSQNLGSYDGLGRLILALITVIPLEVGMMLGAGFVALRHRMGKDV